MAEVLESDTFAYADGGPVSHEAFSMAWNPVIETLGTTLDVAFSASYNSPDDEAPVEESAVTPISISLQVGGSSVDLWVCFTEDAVTVEPNVCPESE